MARISKTKILAVAIVAAIALAVVVLVRHFGSAEDSSQVDWFTHGPSIAKAQDYASPPNTAFENCTHTNLRVSGQSSYSSLCVTPTAMGPMTQIFTNWGYVQPQDGSEAYQIDYRIGGNPIVQPAPYQASGIYFYATGKQDVIQLGLFFQISNHMQLQNFPVYYKVTNALPDMFFTHPNGQFIQFKFNSGYTFPFSQNGRYMFARSDQGFIRINLMDTSVKYFAANPWSSSTTTPGIIDDTGKYGVFAYNSPLGSKYSAFELTDIDSCNTETPYAPTSSAPDYSSCKMVDFMPAVRQLLPSVLAISKPQFVSDRTISFIASYRDASNNLKYAQYTLTADGQLASLKQYEAVGDSYISGEGAGQYRQGTDTQRNQCHQSLASYPYLLGASQSSFASLACSGAKIQNVKDNGQDRVDQLIGGEAGKNEQTQAGQERTPGVIEQYAFVKDDNPDAVTVSIGGNDIGFADLVQSCVNPFKSLSQTISTKATCYTSYEDRKELVDTIDRQFTRLRDLYKHLKDNGTTGRRVYVIGYPQVAKVGGDCGLNVQMNSQEISFTHDVVAHLDSVIKKAADEAGVLYVDTEHALDGHRLCEAPGEQTAINGITIGKTSYGATDIKGSFHPNQLGHQLLAASIGQQTKNLTAPMPAPAAQSNAATTASTDSIYDGAPKTGRAISQVTPVSDLASGDLAPGQPLSVQVKASDYPTKPGASYQLTIGPDRRPLGSFAADASGNLALTTTLPADLPAGFQQLTVTGSDAFGHLIALQQAVTVASGAPGDTDGDGLPDSNDSCPLAVQSGQDIDQDGTDDVCDPQITAPPATPPSSDDGIIWWSNAILPIEIQATSGS